MRLGLVAQHATELGLPAVNGPPAEQKVPSPTADGKSATDAEATKIIDLVLRGALRAPSR